MWPKTPLSAPPGVPAERVAQLRQAFDAAMRDPEYLAEAQKRRLAVEPLAARELESFLNERMADTSPAFGQRLRAAIGL